MAEENNTQLAISSPRYDGPFDLLLSLIRRNEYPIDALPVPAITGQFLAYVRSATDLDADLAGEFVEVASWLVLLKSRSMLPRGADDGPAPHEELRRAVLDHEALRVAKEFLEGRTGRSRPGAAGARAGHEESELAWEETPTVFDMIEAARAALEAARASRSLEGSGADSATVDEMIEWIRFELALAPEGRGVSTREWFETRPEAGAVLLLALLEMAAKGSLFLHQEREFGAICTKAVGGKGEDTQSRAYATAGAVSA
jgi:segregation and condensation protein A